MFADSYRSTKSWVKKDSDSFFEQDLVCVYDLRIGGEKNFLDNFFSSFIQGM